MDLVTELFKGSRLALARAITAVESEYDTASAIMKAIYPKTGRAQILGITGAPGAGKSTLTDKLVKHYLKAGKKIGIIAVDPTSPFSGGAILGDRIRMNDLTLDPNVFIRSMGTRGSLGGLSRKTSDVAKLMDAFGMDLIIIETVGVGQSEVDIVKSADTTLVVLVPGLGDDIQAIKAGILEIGDVFAINKADRDGCDKLNVEIEMMLDLDGRPRTWRPPINRTVASRDEGVDELIESLDAHFAHLVQTGELETRRQARTRDEILGMLEEQIGRFVSRVIVPSESFTKGLKEVEARTNDPYSLVNSLVANIFPKNL
ncbi:methylmalonyl Co-A mutase-associated GTPase MeaB [uncultured Veillonella sp.]|uniref:methylmalonyl Co-A mutase-associated GTPase MeaB n=1 Tax=uncultured Veillonella sp. TaxID=159268 RepID=UPI002618B5AE|nr:methylmalonyl Co-A mutase-associated GTPase MeaB [uncultured Veillonella sp.]